MKKGIAIAVVGIFTIMMGASGALAQAIGYIDVQQVFTAYEKTQAAQADIKEKEQALQKEIEKKQKQIEEAKDAKKGEEEIKKMIEKLEKELEPQRQELFELREKLTAEIQNDIVNATKAVAKEVGIDTVLDKQVFIIGGTDLTSMVVDKLNKSSKNKKK